MKKTLLAIAIPALMSATAVNAAAVYEKDGQVLKLGGRVQTSIENKGASGFDSDTTTSETTLLGLGRLRVEGSTAINSEWKGIAKAEWQVAAENSDNDAKDITATGTVLDINGTPTGETVDVEVTGSKDDGKFKARHVYLGFESEKYGKVIVGQTDTAYYDAIAATDMFNQWGSGANGYSGRQEGQLIYSGVWGGYHAGASYQFADDTASIDAGTKADSNYVNVGKLDYGYAANFGYNFEQGFGFTAGLSEAKYAKAGAVSDVTKSDWALSGSYGTYGVAGFYGAALYNQTALETASSEVNYAGYEVIGIYRLENNVSFLAGYNFREVTDSDFASISEDLKTSDEFLVGAGYDFTSNFLGWVEYAADQIDGNDDRFAATLQYNF